MHLRERITGCILGLALGDALGAPFEGSLQQYGAYPLRGLLERPPPVLRYTDDTEMAIGVAESLISCNGLDPEDMAQRFVRNFNPERGYGRGTIEVLRLIRTGVPWDRANRSVFPEGSFGNGAAMRSAPLGLFFYGHGHGHGDGLKEAVYAASSITHAHPLAIEGAHLVALATSLVLEGKRNKEIMDALMDAVGLKEYRHKLESIGLLLEGDPSAEEVTDLLGNTVEALRSVPAALYSFLRHRGDFIRTVGFCISLGGDTDTISAMAGALSGAETGVNGLPADLLARLEDRVRLTELAEGLSRTTG